MTDAGNGFSGTTHYLFVLDKSGSMESIKDATISGFNEALGDIRNDSPQSPVTITLFDTECSTPVAATLAEKVADLDGTRYSPSGCTALYDAMAKAVRAAEAAVKDGDRALVMVVTDGQENSSRETTKQQALDMVREYEGRGNWTFTYLSASPTAFADGASFGVVAANTTSYVPTTAGTQAGFAALRTARVAYASTGAARSASFYSGPQGATAPPEPAQEPKKKRTAWTS